MTTIKKRFAIRGITYLLCAGVVLFVNACGDSDEKEDTAPKTVYAELTLSDAVTVAEEGSVELTSVNTCSLNTESDYLKVILTGTNGKLIVKVQDAAVDDYSCVQDSAGFDNCFVYAELPAPEGGKTNGYSMAPDSDAGTLDSALSYSGTCQVSLTELSPSVQGSVTCADMVQTKLDGMLPNPFVNTTTATASVEEFHCTPK